MAKASERPRADAAAASRMAMPMLIPCTAAQRPRSLQNSLEICEIPSKSPLNERIINARIAPTTST